MGCHSRLEVTLVLGQQRQRLLAVALSLQDCASESLNGDIVRVVLCKILSQLQRSVGVARNLLSQGLCRGQVGGILFAGDGGQDLASLAEGDLSAELEHAGWELVLWGEGGGVEVDHGLVLAGVEGIVDVEELWERDQWNGR